MRFESQNSGVCSCTHCYHSTGPEEAYSASESIPRDATKEEMLAHIIEVELGGLPDKTANEWRTTEGVERVSVSETVMCGDCMQNYTCRCHLTCETTSPDAVNPYHYTRLTPEPIEVIEAWNLPYHDATALKYLSRHRQKGGAEDIKKAIWFMERILETEYGVEPSSR